MGPVAAAWDWFGRESVAVTFSFSFGRLGRCRGRVWLGFRRARRLGLFLLVPRVLGRAQADFFAFLDSLFDLDKFVVEITGFHVAAFLASGPGDITNLLVIFGCHR